MFIYYKSQLHANNFSHLYFLPFAVNVFLLVISFVNLAGWERDH